MMLKAMQGVVVLASLLAFCGLAPALADEKLDAIVERLGSSSVSERVNAVRDLGRMGLSPEDARPLLEKMAKDPVGTVRSEVVWAVMDVLGEDGVDLLEQFYNDPERRVRDGAIRSACSMFDEERARDLCIVASQDPDHSARIDVLVTLKEKFPRAKEAAALFRKGLSDDSELVQRAAVFGCQAARDPKAIDELVRLAMTGSDHVAVPAVDEALATLATPKAVDELIKMLEAGKGEPGKPARPTDAVRAAAARALARIKDPRSLPALRKVLGDKYTPLRIGAMEALMEMKDKTAVPLIAKQLNEEDERLRRFGLRALRIIGDPSAADAIRKTLHNDKEAVVRATAVATLADLIDKAAIGDLEKRTADIDAMVRLEVAGALAGLGKPAAPTLSKLVRDASPDVRAVAIEGLGHIGGPEEIPMLVKAAESQEKTNKQVRASVAEALGRIGGSGAIHALKTLSQDSEPAVRQRSARALARIGTKDAVTILTTMLKDKTGRVRNTARRELDSLKKRTGAKKTKSK